MDVTTKGLGHDIRLSLGSPQMADISSSLYPRGSLCALPKTRMAYKEAQVVANA